MAQRSLAVMSDPKLRPGVRTGEPGQGAISSNAASDAFREALSRWATGVTVITVKDETGIHGLTATAFAPLSIDPPLVIVCIGRDAPIVTHLQDARRFTINILAQGQKRVANSFSDRFAVALPRFRDGEDAMVEGCLANLVCELERDLDGGDHRLIVGRVVRSEVSHEGEPLLRYGRRYRGGEGRSRGGDG